MPTPDLPPKVRSSFSHYLPRLRREFYQGDAVVFWTLTMAERTNGGLNSEFHAAFREMTLHAASREGLLCPAYCLMPDHLHFVWMGLRSESDQRNGMKFFRGQLGKHLCNGAFQHQPYDHVLTQAERRRGAFASTCSYVLLNPVEAELAERAEQWPFSGAVIPGYPDASPHELDYWPWFWTRYQEMREPGLEMRVLPRREME